jgi:hypothetical protein
MDFSGRAGLRCIRVASPSSDLVWLRCHAPAGRSTEEDDVDGSRFDALARTLTRTRRGLVPLFGGALGLTVLGRNDQADGKRKRKKKKKRCPGGQKLCNGRCISLAQCCNDAECAALDVGGVSAGRICQQGTCICPADKPVIYCTGTCQQCCALDDCRPAGSVDDGQACQDGRCVCTFGGTRRCPAGTKQRGLCGHCCDDSECSGVAECTTLGAFEPSCFCFTNVKCEQVCLPEECAGWCARTCNTAGTPAAGTSCCAGGSLTCQFAPEQGDPNKHRCLPPV